VDSLQARARYAERMDARSPRVGDDGGIELRDIRHPILDRALRERGDRCVPSTFVLDGVELPVRANIGIHTQPISFIGLPVVAVPIPLQPMPIGVQIIGPEYGDLATIEVAQILEQRGFAFRSPPGY